MGSASSPSAASAAVEPDSGVSDDARIIDRGYRSYAGERSGLSGSIRSVVMYSARYALGMGRSARHKILPGVVIAISLGPAAFTAALTVVFNRTDVLDGEQLLILSDYYPVITVALVLFCGIVVPDILVADRRNGMLPLYMSTPLQRWSYLLAKMLAVALTLSLITVPPVLFLMLAYTIQGVGPDGLVEWMLTFARVVVAGVVVSAGFTAAGLAAASLTNRRAFASVGVILLLVGGGTFAGALADVAGSDSRIHALDLPIVTEDLVRRIYGEPPTAAELSPFSVSEFESADMHWEWEMDGSDDLEMWPGEGEWTGEWPPQNERNSEMEFEVGIGGDRSPMSDLSTLFVILAYLGWVSVGSAVVWLRYRRLVVSL